MHSPVWLGNLASLGVVCKVGNNILKHLRARTLLHSREFGRRVAGALTIHYLGEHPLAEHGTLFKHRLLPQVGLVCTHLVPGHYWHLQQEGGCRHRVIPHKMCIFISAAGRTSNLAPYFILSAHLRFHWLQFVSVFIRLRPVLLLYVCKRVVTVTALRKSNCFPYICL